MKDLYREETNNDVYSDSIFGRYSGSYSDEYVKWLEEKLSKLSQIDTYEDWSTKADKNGTINIPDRLDDLVNKIGMQIRFHTISGKNEVQTIVDITKIADVFFNKPKK